MPKKSVTYAMPVFSALIIPTVDTPSARIGRSVLPASCVIISRIFCTRLCSLSPAVSGRLFRTRSCIDIPHTTPCRQVREIYTPRMTGDTSPMRSSIGVRPGVLIGSCGGTSSIICFCSSSLVMLVTVIGDSCRLSESSLRVMVPAVQIDCSSRARFRSLTSTRLIPAFFITIPYGGWHAVLSLCKLIIIYSFDVVNRLPADAVQKSSDMVK